MQLFLNIIFLLLIMYFSYMFIVIMIKMRQDIIYPKTTSDVFSIRKDPEKPVNLPNYREQKAGVYTHAFIILYLIVMYFIASILQVLDSPIYILLILPLFFSFSLFNLFAITHGGILSGSRFISWKRIKSFTFIPIDVNHKFYGFSKEVNKGYQLKIKTIGLPISCLVTDDITKQKLEDILNNHVNVKH